LDHHEVLLGLLVVPEGIVALLQDCHSVFTEEAASSQVATHHVFTVLSVLLPRVEDSSERLESQTFGFSSSISELIEGDLHVLVMGKCLGSQLHTDLLVLFALVIEPSLPSELNRPPISVQQKVFYFSFANSVVSHSISPDHESSHNFLVNVFSFESPNTVEGVGLSVPCVSFALVSFSPVIEHVVAEFTLVSLLDHSLDLLFTLQRFEALLEPLLEASPHSEMADTLEDANEVFEGAMALLVETAVVEKLVHRVLFSALHEGIEHLKTRFCNKEFLVACVAAGGGVPLA